MTTADAEACLTRLPPVERERFRKHRLPLPANEFLLGRLLIRGWLESVSGVAAAEWQFAEGDRGRPAIAHPASAWSFNLAHSGGMVACALSLLPDIGVDLEDLDRGPMSPDLYRRYCSPSEVADIESQPEADRMRRFLTYWTLKEAYLKARGLGIAVHLADVEFSVGGPRPSVAFRGSLEGSDPGWAFELFQPSPRCLLSVAVPRRGGAPPPVIDLRAMSLAALTST